MQVFRICRAAHAALDGQGAFLYGGRWNSPGTALVYAAGSRALTMLEYLVHIDRHNSPLDLILLTIEIPESVAIDSLDSALLPDNWRDLTGSSPCTSIGDDWVRNQHSPVLRLPSVVVPEEFNVVINPLHPDATGITAISSRPAPLDERLMEAG